MPDHRVLLLNSTHLHAYCGRKGHIRLEQSFHTDEAGYSAFRDYLGRHQGSLFYLLADLPEESFQFEVLPFVRGADRTALLNRKLNQYFFGTPFTLSKSLGRSREGRRDEKFLFAALTRPQSLEPWLLAVQETGAALTGIYSTPLVLPALLDKSGVAEAQILLITLTPGGLRQSYFEQGQLRFSRLTPLATGTIEEAATAAAGEAAKIHQYLVGQRVLARGQNVPVLSLASEADQQILKQSCTDTEELSFRFSDIRKVAAAAHLHTPVQGSYADILLVHMLLDKPSVEQFADAGAREHYRRWQLRFGLNMASAGLLALAVLFAIKVGIGVYLDRVHTVDADQAALVEKQRYDEMVKSLPAIPVSPENLRTLITNWNELDARSPEIALSLASLSKAMQTQPQIELQGLTWRLAANPEDPPVPLAASTGATNGTYTVVDVEASLPSSFAGNRRSQNDIVDRFVEALALDPSVQARVMQRPFDTDSGKSLKGSAEAGSKAEKLSFSVRYWRKVQG